MNEASHTGFEREKAEAVSPDPINPKIRQMEVIDTDFHFTPSWKTIRSYLKEPFQSLLFHYPVGSLEYNPEPANEKPGVGQDTHGIAATGADVIKILDQFGTDTVILNPGYNRPQSIFNEPMIAAIAAAHNDYLIKEVFPVSPRIKASLMICHRDPFMGAEEIRRVGHHKQFVTVYSSFSALYEPLGNAKFDPILDAMQEFGLTLTCHSEGFFPHFTPLWNGARTWIELFGNAPAGNCMAHLAAMIVQGMFDKYPNQKVIFQEGGYWWLPDFMLRMDDFYLGSGGDIALVERKLGNRREEAAQAAEPICARPCALLHPADHHAEEPQAFCVAARDVPRQGSVLLLLRLAAPDARPGQLGGREHRLHRRRDAEGPTER